MTSLGMKTLNNNPQNHQNQYQQSYQHNQNQHQNQHNPYGQHTSTSKNKKKH